jgi:hypothetical protein
VRESLRERIRRKTERMFKKMTNAGTFQYNTEGGYCGSNPTATSAVVRKGTRNGASSAVSIATFFLIEREASQSVLTKSAATFVSKRDDNKHREGPECANFATEFLPHGKRLQMLPRSLGGTVMRHFLT